MGAAASSGFANIVMNLDFLSGLGLTVIVSAGLAAVSAVFSLPQFPKNIPGFSIADGVTAGFAAEGENMFVVIEGSGLAGVSAFRSSFSTGGVSFALICSFQRWNSSCV